MARTAIVTAPLVGRVKGLAGDPERLKVRLMDRSANGEAFDDEAVVRLPRRLTVGRLGALERR